MVTFIVIYSKYFIIALEVREILNRKDYKYFECITFYQSKI